ncbi:lipocalin family protein [Agaribacterium sp. ZY112]|uniref:lipocalin family protein n=1 Tax=Agaribacterium sp. ZY112 TaxID=3233574 RepID=UPI003523BDA4
MKIFYLLLSTLLLSSCSTVPKTITPVTGFELDKYLGTWYEIARLDHRFERGLEQVSANYSINDDGTVRVENRGYSSAKKEWKDAIGKAKFAKDKQTGHLKVSFFGPFYGSYIIFDLDKEHYQYSFITGSKNTLWLLARTPQVSDDIKQTFIKKVTDAGYNANELIFVKQK